MDGMVLGWFAAFVIALAVVLMIVIAAVLLPRAFRAGTAHYHCPWKGRDVVVRYVTADGERASAVISCTAFADPMVITCGAPCLPTLRPTGQAAERQAAPAD
jgi:hypothetical protein